MFSFNSSDQRLRPSADQLLEHSFILQNKTGVNSWETQKKNCCGQQDCVFNKELQEESF